MLSFEKSADLKSNVSLNSCENRSCSSTSYPCHDVVNILTLRSLSSDGGMSRMTIGSKSRLAREAGNTVQQILVGEFFLGALLRLSKRAALHAVRQRVGEATK
jgi:hypothetical protein